jgi:hypothetical protein
MSLNFGMSVLSLTEFLLWATVAFLFWRKKLQSRFPAISYYLALRLGSAPILCVSLLLQAQTWGRIFYPVYFCFYWFAYIASAVLLFFVCGEVLRAALAGLPGLMRFGTVIFRWSVVASLIVTFSTISYSHGALIPPAIAFGLMRSVSVLVLCLLAFLCLFMNAIRLSSKDLAFGMALGFGLMSANDLMLSLFINLHAGLTTPLQFAYESVTLASLGIWIAYCALPERAARPVVMPAGSAIYRWNEIASALGHPGTQVAVQQPANRLFLSEVELVVEKVLTRNLNERTSES